MGGLFCNCRHPLCEECDTRLLSESLLAEVMFPQSADDDVEIGSQLWPKLFPDATCTTGEFPVSLGPIEFTMGPGISPWVEEAVALPDSIRKNKPDSKRGTRNITATRKANQKSLKAVVIETERLRLNRNFFVVCRDSAHTCDPILRNELDRDDEPKFISAHSMSSPLLSAAHQSRHERQVGGDGLGAETDPSSRQQCKGSVRGKISRSASHHKNPSGDRKQTQPVHQRQYHRDAVDHAMNGRKR